VLPFRRSFVHFCAQAEREFEEAQKKTRRKRKKKKKKNLDNIRSAKNLLVTLDLIYPFPLRFVCLAAWFLIAA